MHRPTRKGFLSDRPLLLTTRPPSLCREKRPPFGGPGRFYSPPGHTRGSPSSFPFYLPLLPPSARSFGFFFVISRSLRYAQRVFRSAPQRKKGFRGGDVTAGKRMKGALSDNRWKHRARATILMVGCCFTGSGETTCVGVRN